MSRRTKLEKKRGTEKKVVVVEATDRSSSIRGSARPVDEPTGVPGLISKPNTGRKKTQETEPIWKKKRNLLYVIVLYRVASVFLISTEFVPDEAWQSSEVAYYLTYGKGHLTWEWIVGLRSHIYPLFISGIYSILKLVGADTPHILIVVPRLIQGILTAVGDYTFFLYCNRRFGSQSALWSLGCALTCWFTFYTGTRTITNTTEMSLNCIAMYLLDTEKMTEFCGIVALNFAIRPTAVVVWIPQALVILKHFFPPKVPHRIPKSSLAGLGTLVAAALLDWIVYGRPMLSWYRFFKFNFLEGKSAQFGEHHPLWYFYSALPSIAGPNVIILLFSLYYKLHTWDWTIIISFMFCFSLVSHKEIRFLLPVLPYVFVVMGNTLSLGYDFVHRKLEGCSMADRANNRRMFRHAVIFCLMNHFFAAAYFCAFHQGAVKPATEYVNTASKGLPNPEIWVMMSCYSVPVFTYMHNPRAHFEYMTCGPEDLSLEQHMQNFRRYTTNSTELRSFIDEKLKEGVPLPDFVLCFDDITAKLIDVFNELQAYYKVCYSHLHAQFGDDRGMVNVLCIEKSLVPNLLEDEKLNTM